MAFSYSLMLCWWRRGLVQKWSIGILCYLWIEVNSTFFFLLSIFVYNLLILKELSYFSCLVLRRLKWRKLAITQHKFVIDLYSSTFSLFFPLGFIWGQFSMVNIYILWKDLSVKAWFYDTRSYIKSEAVLKIMEYIDLPFPQLAFFLQFVPL